LGGCRGLRTPAPPHPRRADARHSAGGKAVGRIAAAGHPLPAPASAHTAGAEANAAGCATAGLCAEAAGAGAAGADATGSAGEAAAAAAAAASAASGVVSERDARGRRCVYEHINHQNCSHVCQYND